MPDDVRYALPALSVAAAIGALLGVLNNAVALNGNVLLALGAIGILIAGAVAERSVPSRRR